MVPRKITYLLVIPMLLAGCFHSGGQRGTSTTGYFGGGSGDADPAAGPGHSPSADRWSPGGQSHEAPSPGAPTTEATSSGRGGPHSPSPAGRQGIDPAAPPPAPGHGPSSQPSPQVLRHRGTDTRPPVEQPGHGGHEQQRVVIPQPAQRPGLGTVFGEQVASRVNFTSFQRASSQPSGVVSINYNDHQGLMAMARRLDQSCCGAIPAFSVGAGVSVQLVDGYGRPLSGLQIGGRTLVMGAHGHSYGILLRNGTAHRWEIVASVDGLDVVDGRRADFQKRGYVLAPYQTLHIRGFRTSQHAVAAFRFGSVRDSYASRTGSDRNVGVVGVAAFAEYRPPVYYHQPYAQPPPSPHPHPYTHDHEADRRLRAQPFGPAHP